MKPFKLRTVLLNQLTKACVLAQLATAYKLNKSCKKAVKSTLASGSSSVSKLSQRVAMIDSYLMQPRECQIRNFLQCYNMDGNDKMADTNRALFTYMFGYLRKMSLITTIASCTT